jgi:hypothetical protein
MENHDDDDVGWGKVTRPPELSGNPTGRVVCEQVGGLDERSKDFVLQTFCLHLQVIFRTWDLRIYFPSEGRCAADFYGS